VLYGAIVALGRRRPDLRLSGGIMAQPDPKWHVPVRLEDVPETGLHLDLVADESARANLCTLAGLRALPRLEAAIDLMRQGPGLRVSGHVSAVVGQTCVVTLEPLENSIEEDFAVTFSPMVGGDVTDATVHEEEESPEPLVEGVADVGVVATEFLLLGIDRYPRKPGAVFATPAATVEGDALDVGPFGALARLKKGNSTS
jgi:hypothetical protein